MIKMVNHGTLAREMYSPAIQPENLRTTKTTSQGKRKNYQRKTTLKAVQSLNEPINPMNDLKMSLRMECLRLADFLKQESSREGYVR